MMRCRLSALGLPSSRNSNAERAPGSKTIWYAYQFKCATVNTLPPCGGHSPLPPPRSLTKWTHDIRLALPHQEGQRIKEGGRG